MNDAVKTFDLAVIGGGINGTGIANDAAGRGLKVFLCEQGDLACATSSNSSKLIHGGLRYLEHYEFKLVKEALAEREVLLKSAPHIISSLRFQLPYQQHLRPAWMIRIGLFLYDHLAKRVTLSGSKSIKFGKDSPLINSITHGFEYSDGWADDARLVLLNALSAFENNAVINTRTRCVKAIREQGRWLLTLEDVIANITYQISAKSIVNAAGPWVASIFDSAINIPAPKKVRLVKGSHIVVPKIHDKPEAFILQNEDQRIVFVIPFEQDFSLIGTTDVDYEGDPSQCAISPEEVDYLTEIANDYFKQKVTKEQVVYSFSGVRPLLDDESTSAHSVTRDYTLEMSLLDEQAPLLSIFGGKITTHRSLSESAVNKLLPFLSVAKSPWTAKSTLPGGDFDDLDELRARLCEQFTWLAKRLITRLARTYGTRTLTLLVDKSCTDDLGELFGADLYQAEVDYLIQYEWAKTAEDILWRRTKRGLYLTKQQVNRLQNYVEGKLLSASGC